MVPSEWNWLSLLSTPSNPQRCSSWPKYIIPMWMRRVKYVCLSLARRTGNQQQRQTKVKKHNIWLNCSFKRFEKHPRCTVQNTSMISNDAMVRSFWCSTLRITQDASQNCWKKIIRKSSPFENCCCQTLKFNGHICSNVSDKFVCLVRYLIGLICNFITNPWVTFPRHQG